MMVSLGGIDKMGHMWGPEDQGEPGAAPGSDRGDAPPAVRREERRRAGGQDRRRPRREGDPRRDPDRDHRRPRRADGQPVLRRARPGRRRTRGPCTPPSTGIRSDCNWYYGQDADEAYLDPSPAVAALRDRLAGNLAFSYQDTQVAAYLNDTSLAKKQEAAEAVLDMPGVMASYYINGDAERLHPLRHQQDDRRRACLVRPARRRAGRHDGERLGARRRRASRART